MLKKKGIAYLAVGCYSPLFRNYKILREKWGTGDKCHPHSFSIKDMKKIIKDSGFKIKYLREGIGDLGDYVEEKTNTKVTRIKGLVKIPLQKKIMKLLLI